MKRLLLAAVLLTALLSAFAGSALADGPYNMPRNYGMGYGSGMMYNSYGMMYNNYGMSYGSNRMYGYQSKSRYGYAKPYMPCPYQQGYGYGNQYSQPMYGGSGYGGYNAYMGYGY